MRRTRPWHSRRTRQPRLLRINLPRSYFRSFDLPVATLRPFNTYGPRQSMRAVLPTIMAQALFADEIVVGSLEPVRDMNYVSDTVAAFLAVGEQEGVIGELFNIGSSVGRSIAEMINAVQEVAGTNKPVRQDAARVRPEKSEVNALICDYRKAEATFGYRPVVDFAEGLGRLRDYLAEHAPSSDVAVYRI